MKWILLLYNICFPVVFLGLLPGFIARMLRRGNYRHKFGQRFALYSSRVGERLRARRGEWIWVHAVSVGEVLIALKFIDALQARTGGPVLLSTTTSTGFQLADRRRRETLEVIYHPVDLWPCARRAMHLIRPRALVLVEAEVWPNLTAQARKQGAATMLINARLSPRSESRYRRFRAITGPFFRQLDLICVQTPDDVERWRALGVPSERLFAAGSIKFDDEDATATAKAPAEFVDRLAAEGVSPDAPVLLAGSTHDGEERLLAENFRALRERVPELFFILVPRHFERSDAIVADLESLGLRVSRRTRSPAGGRPDVLLIDTTGELKDWYRFATVVFIGKSLTARGGQNPAEAVQVGKPVVFGPHMENFADFTRVLLANHGAVQVRDRTELAERLEALLLDAEFRQRIVAGSGAALQPHRGATRRTLEKLTELLDARHANRQIS